jgi:hypothetical protein
MFQRSAAKAEEARTAAMEVLEAMVDADTLHTMAATGEPPAKAEMVAMPGNSISLWS